MNHVLLLGTLGLAALVAVFLLFRPSPAPSGTFDLRDLPRLGAENAPVTVVIVEDFKCPVCKAFEEQIAPELKSRYVDTGKVKVYSLVFPFLGKKFGLEPDDSVLAAQAAQCVYQHGGDDAFQAFKTILFRAQGEETRVWATAERLSELAGNVEGLNLTRFTACLTSNATLPQVTKNTAQVEKNKVNGTPAIFVNGALIGWDSFAVLREKLFKQLDTAARP